MVPDPMIPAFVTETGGLEFQEGLSQHMNEEERPGDPSGATSVIRARTMHARSVWLLQQSYACLLYASQHRKQALLG